MSLDLDLLVKALTFLMSVAAVIYAWFSSRKKDVDARFKEASKRMDKHAQRIAALEQSLKAMPDKDDMHALQLGQERQSGHLKEIHAMMKANAESMKRIERTVGRHEDHLLEGKNK